ncbi:G-protein coupled receptor moody isoform X2 [Sitodiplosis mosellana]|uniref:G-protein coupled receptor moody isoform X2 n=1 Tax=Sitodiplosis mosellana TaxID=263140 RepID=UPI00244390C7|nr:G-protein coupled receptor moody isoform X2 [Sitodiplosis mosellana]
MDGQQLNTYLSSTLSWSLPPDDELFKNYPAGLLYFATAACIVFILLGIPGNLITIIALARCKKVRNATAVFIINLSLSDLLFCCFNLPLAASTFWNRAWTHGALLCRIYPLFRYGLLAVSLFTVLAITINRYVMIGHPRIYPRIYRRKYLGVMVATTWLGAFCSLIPTWQGKWGRFGLDRPIGSCSILPDKDNTSPKEFLFIMAFVVPCISIVVCYARIFYIVRKTALRSHHSDTGSALGNSMHQSSGRAQNNNQCKKLYATNNNKNVSDGTDVQLLPKSDDMSGDSGGGVGRIERVSESTVNNERNEKKHFSGKNLLDSDNSSALLSHSQSHGDIKSAMKFIDSTIDGETLSALRKSQGNDEHNLTANDRNLSNVSISRTVEFIEANGERHNSCDRDYIVKLAQENGDSAIEESISSTENNQVYHIKSNNNCLQILSVQVEPSSSSGIDLHMDNDSPPRRMKRSYTSSIRRSKRGQRSEKCNLSGSSCTIGSVTSRKASGTTNTSGASILYPGRMTTKDRRLLKMILVIFVSFVTCYLPITSTKIIRTLHNIPVFHIMGYILIYLTTCINPIIYVVMSSEYRQAYWNLLMCRMNKRTKRSKNYHSNRNHFQKNSQIKVTPNKT